MYSGLILGVVVVILTVFIKMLINGEEISNAKSWPNPPVRPNPAGPARPPESGRTRKWEGRPNPTEIGYGTAARIRPNSDMDGRPNLAERGN